MFVRTVTTSDCFRGLASMLAADDAEGGIPAEVIDEVRVLGLDGWQADFAKFCWIRDDNFPLLGRDFVDFDDWHLERIYGQAGALSDLYKVKEKAVNANFHDSFWRLHEERNEIEALTDQKLSDIVRSFNLTGRPDFWDALLLNVHDLAEQRSSETEAAAKRRALELGPIRAYAERARYQRVGGPRPDWGNSLVHRGIIQYIQSYWGRTGKYPAGRHTVSYSSGRFSTSTLEVQFPDED